MRQDDRAADEDPQTAELAAEIEESRGETLPFLIWSGSLPAASDERQAVNLLVREPWWRFTGEAFNPEGELDEIDEGWAIELLTWLIGNTMAYDVELIPVTQAAQFAARFVALLPSERRWFTNGDRAAPGDFWYPRPSPWNPLTAHTFDTGVVAAAEERAWIAWFTDED
jgi:hypothetical protein